MYSSREVTSQKLLLNYSKPFTNQQTFAGHKGVVRALAALPDNYLASGSDDSTIKIWNIRTGECVKTLSGHTNSVYGLKSLPHNQLASASYDKLIKIWDVQTGKCLQILSGHTDAVIALVWTSTNLLISGSDDKTIKIWDINTGHCRLTLKGHAKYVNALTMLADDKLASASSDTTIKIWDINTGECLLTLCGHATYVRAVITLPNGHLASCSSDGKIKIWDINSGQCLQTLDHESSIYSLTLLPDQRLATLARDTSIKIWDINTNKCLQVLKGDTSWTVANLLAVAIHGWVSDLVILSDGRLASSFGDATIKIWDFPVLEIKPSTTVHELEKTQHSTSSPVKNLPSQSPIAFFKPCYTASNIIKVTNSNIFNRCICKIKEQFASEKPKTCFINYAWGNEYTKLVQNYLVNYMRLAGFTVPFDLDHGPGAEPMPKFLDHINDADYIVVVGTKKMLEKYNWQPTPDNPIAPVVRSELIRICHLAETGASHKIRTLLIEGNFDEALPPALHSLVRIEHFKYGKENYFDGLIELIKSLYAIPTQKLNELIELSEKEFLEKNNQTTYEDDYNQVCIIS